MRRLAAIASALSVVAAGVLLLELPANVQSSAPSTYLGFDLNTYPGDAALPVLRKTFAFAGYWLRPPPGAKQNTWLGKRALLQAQGFGFLLLYRGPQSRELKSQARARQKGAFDAREAASAAKRAGFPPQAIIFLDIEEGGRLPAKYHAYLQSWIDALAHAGYRAGVYCSGMLVNEGGGVTIITADDIRDHLGPRPLAYFVYNDACPPAPGCVVSKSPPPPSSSGISYAAVWQFAQSPRRREFTPHCAATYNSDNNCYAPGDTAHVWFLDLNTAASPDPSSARE